MLELLLILWIQMIVKMAEHSKSDLYLYNSLTRKKEKFEPINPPYVGLYVCGPTVYGDPHLGHARPSLTFDLLFRYLKHLGYKVRYVRNITDVGHLESDADEGEDKVLKKARLEELEPMEVVQYYTNRFRECMNRLNVLEPSIEPLASGHIIEQPTFLVPDFLRQPQQAPHIVSCPQCHFTQASYTPRSSIPWVRLPQTAAFCSSLPMSAPVQGTRYPALPRRHNARRTLTVDGRSIIMNAAKAHLPPRSPLRLSMRTQRNLHSEVQIESIISGSTAKVNASRRCHVTAKS